MNTLKTYSVLVLFVLALQSVSGATLVGHWTFDEGTGTIAADLAGAHDGTLIGDTTWTAGHIGSALYFDGIDDWVATTQTNEWSTAPFSYSLWINPKATAWRAMLGANEGLGPSLFFKTGNFALLKGQSTVTSDGTQIVPNVWSHIVITYDANGDFVHYVNGVQTLSGNSPATFEQKLMRIGTLRDGKYDFYGSIDDVRVYNGILTASDVSQLYTGTIDNTTPSVPFNVTQTGATQTSIDLAWPASSDPESGVVSYKVYRDNVLVGSPIGESFTDVGLVQNTAYTYQVSAVNGEGLESEKSSSVVFSTLADTTAPTIDHVNATTTQVIIGWSEPVDSVTAQNVVNYNIPGLTVNSALLLGDGKTVVLSTTDASAYTLTATNVEDNAGNSAPDSENYQLLGCFI